jgi:hypothetical protein
MSPAVLWAAQVTAVFMIIVCLAIVLWARWSTWADQRRMRKRDERLKRFGLDSIRGTKECYRDIKGIHR